MSDEFEDIEEIRNMFTEILGSEVKVVDNIDNTELDTFVILIKKLEEAVKAETKSDISEATDPLWFVVEIGLKFMYGEEAADLIYWYIFDRFEKDGSVIPLEDEDGKIYIFKDVKEFYGYLKYKFIEHFED